MVKSSRRITCVKEVGMKGNVIITGASRGIGRACAELFAKEGWNLSLLCAKNYNILLEMQDRFKKLYGVETVIFRGDAGNFSEMQEFILLAESKLGPADLLINNAGICRSGLLTDMTPEEWDEVIRTNLTSVFNLCRLAVPGMVARKSGRIINVSSVWGLSGASCEAAYSASKGGINAFTQGLARELAPSGIPVNAVAFGAVDTDMNRGYTKEEIRELEEEIPACRMASPEEAAQFIMNIACAPSYLTGEVIKFDGGWK